MLFSKIKVYSLSRLKTNKNIKLCHLRADNIRILHYTGSLVIKKYIYQKKYFVNIITISAKFNF